MSSDVIEENPDGPEELPKDSEMGEVTGDVADKIDDHAVLEKPCPEPQMQGNETEAIPENVIMELIRLVKKNTCLYDWRDEDFKNCKKKNNSWLYISRKLGMKKPECKRIYNNLLKKFSSIYASRSAEERELPEESFVYYKEMLFIACEDIESSESSNEDVDVEGDSDSDDVIVVTPVKEPAIVLSSDDDDPMAVKSTDASNLQLIRAVKEYPCIYDPKDPFYCSSSYRTQTWDGIAQKLGRTREDCQRTYLWLYKKFAEHFILMNVRLPFQPVFPKENFHYFDEMLFASASLIPSVASSHHPGHVCTDERRIQEDIKQGQQVECNKPSQKRAHEDPTESVKHIQKENYPEASTSKKIKGNEELNTEETEEIHLLKKPSTENPLEGTERFSEENPQDRNANEATRHDLSLNDPQYKFNVQLIRAVKENPSLYNPRDPFYLNPFCTPGIWDKIAQKLRTTRDHCQKTFSCLQQKFTENFQRRVFPAKKAFPYYEEMYFLAEFIRQTVREHQGPNAWRCEFKIKPRKADRHRRWNPYGRRSDKSSTFKAKPAIQREILQPFGGTMSMQQANEKNKNDEVILVEKNNHKTPMQQPDQPNENEESNNDPSEEISAKKLKQNHSGIELFFKSFTQQVQQANLSEKEFVNLQLAILSALAAKMTQK